MNHWSHDIVLRALESLREPFGSLVTAFPGSANISDNPNWLNDWFLKLVELYAIGNAPDEFEITISDAKESDIDLSPLSKAPVESKIRLKSIKPHYFRGFREISISVNIDSDLMVIEGLNSSGKTSLSEAIEWVFTGVLSRRSSGQYGHPRELANCISNEFRPNHEETWVEILLEIDGQDTLIKRTLIQDYQPKQASIPLSELYVDGTRLDTTKESNFLDKITAGLHPILMQHTLRQFVNDQPDARRQYFERLLQIDELTELISRAVIGKNNFEAIKPKTGSPSFDAIQTLSEIITDNETRKLLEDLTDGSKNLSKETFQNNLTGAALNLFPDMKDLEPDFKQCKSILENEQARIREIKLPILTDLKSPLKIPVPELNRLFEIQNSLVDASFALETASNAASELDDLKLAVSKAFEILVDASLISINAENDQSCPICLEPSKTLSQSRVLEIHLLQPLASAFEAAKESFNSKEKLLAQETKNLQDSIRQFKVNIPEDDELDKILGDNIKSVKDEVKNACKSAQMIYDCAENLALSFENITHEKAIDPSLFNDITSMLETYREIISNLEATVGESAKEDPIYLLRDHWLNTASYINSYEREFNWFKAKITARQRLETIRKALIDLRSEIIENARRTFSKQITDVWKILRSDTGAKFSQLQIPTARGKGYKLELEVKASITDGNKTMEVDALRVFSESQINVIGIAAYVTRSRLLGHKVLIFDDPVQSMDEEHFITFAKSLLSVLLDEGFQIIIMTHSEQFARRISYYHYKRLNYATLKTRFSKRKGCQVDEGNRRISERLKLAQRFGEDGELEKAWRLVRLALERLYTLVMVSSDNGFNPESWKNATAEFMWDQGSGSIIEAKIQGSGPQLKEILEHTVVGAHDKTAKSQTDLFNSINYLKSLLVPLRIGN